MTERYRLQTRLILNSPKCGCGFMLILLTAVNPVGTAIGVVLSSNSGANARASR
jgi:hypothetical protein